MSHRLVILIVAAVLLATTDDRQAGAAADGRQMIWTAVAIAETGELGQAPGRDLTFPRPAGDSVSRFGLAMSFAQVPAAMAAPIVEGRLGRATSQPLFLVAPFVFVLLAAWFTGLAVRELGGNHAAVNIGILLASLAGPLAAYATLDTSESLQALALIVALWASLKASRSDHPASPAVAAVAGGACGLAVLTKSSLLVVAPFALMPLLATPAKSRVKVVLSAAIGFACLAAVWLYFEFARFGTPLMGYAGEHFSHPLIDGAWRLLIGPNKGFVLYFPASIAAALAASRLVRAGDPRTRLTVLGSFLSFIALLLMSAGWWAWHGDDGWGPRLLVPLVPLIAVCAAPVLAAWPRSARFAMIGLSMLLNLPPLLQHPTPVFQYRVSSAWPAADAAVAARLPRFARDTRDGKTVVVPDTVLASLPQASPFITLPWFFMATHASTTTERERDLANPPWKSVRPDIIPPPSEITAMSAATPQWRFWGRSFFAGGALAAGGAYDAALADQVLRAQALRRLPEALDLARKLEQLAPDGFADALLLEGYRLQHRRPDAVQFLNQLPRDRREHPAINVVLALFERDRGENESAHALLASVAENFPDSPVTAALSQPIDRWPADFGAMTKDDRLQVAIR